MSARAQSIRGYQTLRTAHRLKESASFQATLLFIGYFCFAGLLATTHGNRFSDLDERAYHLVEMNWFIIHGLTLHFPSPSATTPGLHWLGAIVMRALGSGPVTAANDLVPRLICAAFGAGFVTCCWLTMLAVSKRQYVAWLFLLPVVSSSYMLLPSARFVTETPSYFGFGLMELAMVVPAFTIGWVVLFALGGAIGTLARQMFLAVAGSYSLKVLRRVINTRRITGFDVMAVAISVGVPVLAFLPLAIVWRGVVPPEYTGHQVGPNTGCLAQTIGLAGVFGPVFLAGVFRERLTRSELLPYVYAGLAAAVFWALIPTSWTPGITHTDRQFSVVWDLGRIGPTYGEHALFVLPLLISGAICITYFIRHSWRAGAPEWIVFALYTLAFFRERWAWQRYAEVPLLLTFSISAARMLPTRSRVALLCFLGFFFAYFALSFYASFIYTSA